jgi:hypothetical protein
VEVEGPTGKIPEVEIAPVVERSIRVERPDGRCPAIPGLEAAAAEADGVRVEEPDSRPHLVAVVDPSLVAHLDDRLGGGVDAGHDLDPTCAADEAVGALTGEPRS